VDEYGEPKLNETYIQSYLRVTRNNSSEWVGT